MPIELLILDVDGVLTDGTFTRLPSGEELKFFHSQDGHGMKTLMKAGIPIAIISGRESTCVSQRMAELGVKHVFQGQSDKRLAFKSLTDTLNISPSNIAYVGDDTPDICIMEAVGHPIAVANATPDTIKAASWQTARAGGQGAVREVCDWILAQ